MEAEADRGLQDWCSDPDPPTPLGAPELEPVVADRGLVLERLGSSGTPQILPPPPVGSTPVWMMVNQITPEVAGGACPEPP